MSELVGGKLLLVGCGKMGGALLQGWLAEGLPAGDVVVVEPAAAPAALTAGVATVAAPAAVPSGFRPAVVVFAVKPQSMAEVVPHYHRFQADRALFLSIAAGTKIGFFEQRLGTGAAVVRVMPNTPAAIRRGMSVLCANPHVSARQKATAGRLMAAAGATAWLDDEGLMDAVTAVSGSGPGFVFAFAEAWLRAAEAAGLAPELAERLVKQTLFGAAALWRQSAEPVDRLRAMVTSPGGTTLAGLEALEAREFGRAVAAAIEAAARRSRELSAG